LPSAKKLLIQVQGKICFKHYRLSTKKPLFHRLDWTLYCV